MNKIFTILLVAILLGSGAFFYFDMQKNSSNSLPTTTTEEKMEPPTETMKGEAKIFNVTAANFSFSVKEMKVKQGDTVKIVFENKEGFHDWVIDEFNARTQQLPAGKSETIEFVADKNGTFEYYCSVGSHRANGMVGKLIVE